ncbi:hypothetical protein ARALYDRAFT_906403 [Arabidopsis lyrata subsp. lyrata]|uniref:F-box domain-containing protein n=1 Tax=Arabidopsis lyrata subsp. lyrata TaxID=81972 RepID=D7LTI2_ARALL|nr:hypothetical protein ARALYDRAFT_906403 [Arabidopsis lyrata subsp. lyrata]
MMRLKVLTYGSDSVVHYTAPSAPVRSTWESCMLRTRDMCALVCVPHTCDTETSSRSYVRHRNLEPELRATQKPRAGAMGPIKPSSPTMHVTVGIKICDHLMEMTLPRDLEDEILSRVPDKSLARFRCVCKQWNTQLVEETFLAQHSSRIIRVYKIVQCTGLLVCVMENQLLIWNPYLKVTRWIKCSSDFHRFDDAYGLGFIRQSPTLRNYKIVRFRCAHNSRDRPSRVEVYDFQAGLRILVA